MKPRTLKNKIAIRNGMITFWEQHPEAKLNLSNKLKGIPKSGITKENMRKAQMGHKVTQATRNNLKFGLVKHHKDGDRNNNNPENLLATNRSEHMKIHHRQGDIPHKMVGGGYSKSLSWIEGWRAKNLL